jgi:hypothetical protein
MEGGGEYLFLHPVFSADLEHNTAVKFDSGRNWLALSLAQSFSFLFSVTSFLILLL